jgi:hypothetical protein
MASICATASLARALGLTAELPRADTVDARGASLPIWYLDIVHARGAKIVLAVETGTRWAFVLPAAPFATLADRFGPALFAALLAAGVPPAGARAEIEAGSPYTWARLLDRGAQAHLRQCKDDVAWTIAQGGSLALVNRRLGSRPIIKPRESWPEDEVLRLLGGDPELPARRAREDGRQWQEAHESVRAQSGASVLRLPVAKLLRTDYLETAYQARILFLGVPGSPLRAMPSAREAAPNELILEMGGIHGLGAGFLDEIAALAALHAPMAVRLEGLEPGVLQQAP